MKLRALRVRQRRHQRLRRQLLSDYGDRLARALQADPDLCLTVSLQQIDSWAGHPPRRLAGGPR
jgi:hypothetical protein